MTTQPQAGIHYLTVQDILWINHEVTNEVLPYKFAQLEEATFGQYAYGGSHDAMKQASTLLAAFGRLRPFSAGNRATAFVAVLSFLVMNGYSLALDPANAVAWFEKASGRTSDALAGIRDAVAEGEPQPQDLKPVVRTTVREVIKTYSEAIPQLAD